MLTLRNVAATAEQLKIISSNRPGVEIIKGAAGSGKTTTALLKLKSSIAMAVSRRERLQDTSPVNVLVLTFNRTLRGYIAALAEEQIDTAQAADIQITTFGKWARDALDSPTIIANGRKDAKIRGLATGINLPYEFLLEEIEYAMTRFMPENIDNYATARRDGRGATPRVDKTLREQIISQVIKPYWAWLTSEGLTDWNGLAVELAENSMDKEYDIIIVDETQDFSANQLRALTNQLADVHTLTFVVDTAQRIYARGFTWQEAGINVRPEQIKRLERNYRNTIEIAQFVAPLLAGLTLDDDATMPDFSKCITHGSIPVILEGRYNGQLSYVMEYLRGIDLSRETVAFLKPKGGNWFSGVKQALDNRGFSYVEITKEADWPEGDANIALCTLHSAKGLEFDHVIMLGLNREVLQHDEDVDDDRHSMYRRLLAMGISRSKKSVILGYKPEDMSFLINYFDDATFDKVAV